MNHTVAVYGIRTELRGYLLTLAAVLEIMQLEAVTVQLELLSHN